MENENVVHIDNGILFHLKEKTMKFAEKLIALQSIKWGKPGPDGQTSHILSHMVILVLTF